jgi:hypothetical protein
LISETSKEEATQEDQVVGADGTRMSQEMFEWQIVVNTVMHYNYHSSGYYPASCLLFKTQFNSVGFSVPHRKHITSPLRAQQVNAVYRFVTMVY